MKYSIIIPAYNIENYIANAIESIIKQDYNDLELIIVNDGSNDDTGKICHKYEQKFNWIKVIDKQNGGVSSARNEGIRNAAGKYIYFLDGDDEMAQGVFKEIDTKPDSDAYFSTRMLTHDLSTNIDNDRVVINKELSSSLSSKEIAIEIILCNGNVPVTVWRSNIIKENNIFFDEAIKIGEDDEWQERTIKLCDKICLVEMSFYVYNLKRTNSATTTIKLLPLYSGMLSYDNLIHKYEQYEGYKKKELLQRFAGSYWNIARKCFYKGFRISQKEFLLIKSNKYTLKYTNFKVDKLTRICVAVLGIKLGIKLTNIIVQIFSKK